MTRQRVRRYGVVLVARSTLTAQRLQSCVLTVTDCLRRWNDEVCHAQQNANGVDEGCL